MTTDSPGLPSRRSLVVARAPATRGQRARRAWLIALLVGAAGATGAAHAADDEAEREALSRIAAELQQVQVLVTKAAQSAPAVGRVKFRYDWLERDLQMLREGVMQHVDAPRQPRPVPPLRGDYRN